MPALTQGMRRPGAVGACPWSGDLARLDAEAPV